MQIYKNGIPIFQNERLKQLELSRNSSDLDYLYTAFTKCFGESSYDISIERYQFDHFVLAFNLSSNPIVAQEKTISFTSSNRNLAPLDAGVIDVEVTMKSDLAENIFVYFCAVSEVLCRFDNNGIPNDDMT